MPYAMLIHPGAKLDRAGFRAAFADRPGWALPEDDPSVATFCDPATFVTLHAAHDGARLRVVVDLARHVGFGEQAADEIAKLALELGGTVEDPQRSPARGLWHRGAFLAAWDTANRRAYAADPDAEWLTHPRVVDAWRWNRDRGDVEARNGGLYRTALLWFAWVDGRVVSLADVVPDRSRLIPKADRVLIRARGCAVLAGWDDAAAALGMGRWDETPGAAVPYWAVVDRDADVGVRELVATHPRITALDVLGQGEVHQPEDVAALVAV